MHVCVVPKSVHCQNLHADLAGPGPQLSGKLVGDVRVLAIDPAAINSLHRAVQVPRPEFTAPVAAGPSEMLYL